MAKEIIMPKFGMAQKEGTIVEWLKQEGESIEQGKPLLIIETDKTTVEVEAPVNGILLRIGVQSGATVPVTTVIGYIGEPGEEIEAPMPISKGDSMAPSHQLEIGGIAMYKSARQSVHRSHIRATPVARRIAKERGIDLSLVRGSGPKGAITRADIEAFMVSENHDKAMIKPLSNMRRSIARKMSTSWHAVPHISFNITLNMTNAEDHRARWNEVETRPKVSVSILLIKAVADTLTRHLGMNASYRDDGILYFQEINIGIAVALKEGLIVPVLKNANHLSLEEIAERYQWLTLQAREMTLKPIDVADGTFTITNLGMFGIDDFTAIIYPPQSAILAIGALKQGVSVEKGEIVVRTLMRVTLSVDHRVADGAMACRFLADLKNSIEGPNELFADS